MVKIKHLQRYGDHGWMWRIEGEGGYYYTSKGGSGIFHDDPNKGIWNKQLVGMSQFEACATASGMRRKLNRYYNEED